jgi:uncharacterized protein YjbI with pentapeptide repeats
MANPEHVEILDQGVEVWNRWRRENPGVAPGLRGAHLEGAYLRDANLNATNLSNATLEGAILIHATLEGAILFGPNLSYANLSGANLEHAILRDANLTDANLSCINAINTDFQGAILTGACIRDWHINADTNLQDVVCDYVYMGAEWKDRKLHYTDRRPHDSTQNFAPGEFTKRYQKVLDSVDLFFNDGIDWRAFLATLHDLQTEYGDEVSIQSFEKKAGGAFLIKLEVPTTVDKGLIEQQAKEFYQQQLQLVEAQYRQQLLLKDKEIEGFKRESANIMKMAELWANRPITIEAIAVANADNQSKTTNYNLPNAQFGGGFAAEGGTQTGGTLNDYSTQQDLAAAAQDIQSLLNQLSQTYPSTTITEQAALATKAVEELKRTLLSKHELSEH